MMSTRSLIALHNPNGTYTSVYCHFDGYNHGHGVGPTLRAHYASKEHAEALVGLGDLSYIDTGSACAYHRDHGKDWAQVKPRHSAHEADLLKLAKASGAHYIYVYRNDAWSVHTVVRHQHIQWAGHGLDKH